MAVLQPIKYLMLPTTTAKMSKFISTILNTTTFSIIILHFTPTYSSFLLPVSHTVVSCFPTKGSSPTHSTSDEGKAIYVFQLYP